jgi:hypothetical protein
VKRAVQRRGVDGSARSGLPVERIRRVSPATRKVSTGARSRDTSPPECRVGRGMRSRRRMSGLGPARALWRARAAS